MPLPKNDSLPQENSHNLSEAFKPRTWQSYPTESWMEFFASRQFDFRNKYLLDLTMPGSHDAATYTMQSGSGANLMAKLGQRFTVTQTCSLVEQFKLGVRYFDIRIKRAPHTNDVNSLVFFHGSACSAKNIVLPELNAFLDHIRSTKEIAILKFHFESPEDFQVLMMEFGDIFYVGSLESLGVISPDELATTNIGSLMQKNRHFLILTHKAGKQTSKTMDYKSNTSGGWAKTRKWDRLAAHMEATRADTEKSLDKLKIVQTNQPGLVGSGGYKTKAVLDHDSEPESRNTVYRFVEQSTSMLEEALYQQDELKIKAIRQNIRGVISLDNIGADSDKALLIQKIIELNDDQGLEERLGISRL